jgi:hypothetical protein
MFFHIMFSVTLSFISSPSSHSIFEPSHTFLLFAVELVYDVAFSGYIVAGDFDLITGVFLLNMCDFNCNCLTNKLKMLSLFCLHTNFSEIH